MELHEQYSFMLKKYDDQGDKEISSLEEASLDREEETEDEELASAMSTLTPSADVTEVCMLVV